MAAQGCHGCVEWRQVAGGAGLEDRAFDCTENELGKCTVVEIGWQTVARLLEEQLHAIGP